MKQSITPITLIGGRIIYKKIIYDLSEDEMYVYNNSKYG